MKIVTISQLEILNDISMRVEHAESRNKDNQVVKDMRWLINELSRAYTQIEDLAKENKNGSDKT